MESTKAFGEIVRELRETQGLLQRQVAAHLEIDSPMLSKIERGERLAKREQVIAFAQLFRQPEDELLAHWLADQVTKLLKEEPTALQSLQIAQEQIVHYGKPKP